MSEKKTQKKNKKKLDKAINVVFVLLFGLLSASLAFGGYKIYETLHTYKEAENSYESVIEAVRKSEESNSGNQEETAADPGLDFDALIEMNPDFVGWIRLEDTVVDYPVVKTGNNDYYLRRLFNRERNNAGCLFVDFRNGDLFNDQVTLIYGHNMHNGSMFHVVEEYKKQEYYDAHPVWMFYTPKTTYKLEPFAGKLQNAEVPFVAMNFVNQSEFFRYIDAFIRDSLFESDVVIEENDRIVMLVTCGYDYTSARYVLLCRVSEI